MLRELKEVQLPADKSGLEGVQASPDGDNMLQWNLTITGPADTPYAGKPEKKKRGKKRRGTPPPPPRKGGKRKKKVRKVERKRG